MTEDARKQLYDTVMLAATLIAAVATVIGATYAVVAFHGASAQMDSAREQKTETAETVIREAAKEPFAFEVGFVGLDMDLTMWFNVQDKDAEGGFVVPLPPGGWMIPPDLARAMMDTLRDLKSALAAADDAEVQVRIDGVADALPFKPRSGQPWRYWGPSLPNAEAFDKQGVLRPVSLLHGEPLTNLKLAYLRARAAAELVWGVFPVEPVLYAYESEAIGNRYAVIHLRIVNALLDDYREMNLLERNMTSAAFAWRRAVGSGR